jgi:hypothetical protein
VTSPEDLVNKGFIVNRESGEQGRTFIVTGLQRSGTSLVASILQQVGIFIGSEINDAVYEDEAIGHVLASRDVEGLRQIIAVRNARHIRWGFKRTMLWRELGTDQLALFDKPRLIITFRDPVSMAVRTSLSEYQDAMRALADIVTNQAKLIDYVSALRCPNLLLSYEKALSFPNDFVDTIVRFCGISPDRDLRARLLALIEPNRQRYLVTARRRFDGLIEGVRGEHLYGWCCLTRSTEPVTLDVLVDDRVAMTVVAEIFRQDLLDAGFGEGRHGYLVPLIALQARPDSVIRVRVAGHGIELDNSGTRLSDFGSAAA